jgi:hypothetical protein
MVGLGEEVMSQLYEVLFNLEDRGGNLVGVPAPSNTNNAWSSDHFVFSKRDHGMSSKDPHIVRFTLVNDLTGRDLRFPSDRHDAMWVQDGETCPQRDSPRDYSAFEPLMVIDEGRTLLAINRNNKKRKIGFTLNFLPEGDEDPSNSIPWDPIGDNQNGGRDRFLALYTCLAVAGATAAVSVAATKMWLT